MSLKQLDESMKDVFVRYVATGLTQRVSDKCDACRVDCISRVRQLVGCLALTDE